MKKIQLFLSHQRKLISGAAVMLIVAGLAAKFLLGSTLTQAAVVELDTQTANQIQVDVANRYRAIMVTNDTDDFISFYDRAEDDAAPDKVFEINGPSISDGTTRHRLRWDDSRRTTILEASSTRIKIRVEGKLDSTTGGNYVDDDGADDDIIIRENYTFTAEGAFVSQEWDLKDGITLVAAGTGPDSDDGLSWIFVSSDDTDAAHTDTILYGDGDSETDNGGVDAATEDTYKYAISQGQTNYQDVYIGVPKGGWFDASGGTDDWYVDVNNGTNEVQNARETGHSVSGMHYTNFFIQFHAQTDLDTAAEREALINDIRNPDLPSYTTGTEWNDGAGNTSLGAPAAASPGLNFDANTKYVDVSDNAALKDYTAFTLMAWINPLGDPGADGGRIVHKTDGGTGDDYGLMQYDIVDACGGVPQYAVGLRVNTSTGITNTCANTIPTPNTGWYHIAATWDGSNTEIFVNGVSDGNGSRGGTLDNSNLSLGIGRHINSTTRNFNGLIDEVRIYNTNLSGSQIRESMSNQINPGTSNLVGYWRFNENTGTTAFDETVNDNDGTLTGSPVWSTGYAPDQYNEAEGNYTIDMNDRNQAEIDLDGGLNVSTLIDDATDIEAGATSITVDATTGFPSSGIGYINGDKFSYGSTDGTTFAEIPPSGELSLIGHADNSVVSLANRHESFYKFRNWRSLGLPGTATLEGNVLTGGTDYNAAVKPVTDAYFAQDLTWYSSLNTSTTNPNVGSTTFTDDATAYQSGKYGSAAEFNANADSYYVTVSEGADYSKAQGAVEFWYQPYYDYDDNTTHNIFNIAVAGSSNDRWYLFKFSNNNLAFRYNQNGTDITYTIDAADYSWKANDWIHLRVEWDDSDTSAPFPDQQKIFINGTEPNHTDSGTDMDSSTLGADPNRIFIGNLTNASSDEANGLIDEFKVYSTNTSLTKLSVGGDVSDTDEYLADETNDYTLSFAADDANNRGEYIWLGSDSQFQGLNTDLATLGVDSSADFDWEYWNGTAWSALTVTDANIGASQWTASGNFYWTAPGNWFPYSVNGSTDLYYIRGHLESGSYTTSPIESVVKTDILLFNYLGDIAAEDTTLAINKTGRDADIGGSPVARWLLDEGQGGTAEDGEGGHDLDINGPAWIRNEDKSDPHTTYLQFDGSNDYLSRDHDGDFDFDTESFTVTGSFRHSSTISGTDTLLANYSDAGYKIYMNSSGYLCFAIDDDSTWGPAGTDEACSTTSYADSQWHNFSAVKSGITSITLYVDGYEVDQETGTAEDNSLNTGATFYIGIDEGGSTNPWDGFIDDIAVYHYARSEAQIRADVLGAQTSASFGSQTDDNLTDGLVGWWQMDDSGVDAEDEISTDSSGNGNNGTLYGDDGSGDNGTGMDCTVAGKFGTGCDFDGTDDYVDYGNIDIAGTDLTISAWINPTNYAADQRTILAKDTGTLRMVFRVETDGSLNFLTRNAATTHKQTAASVIDTDTSTWQHVMVVYDDSEDDATMYVNGVAYSNTQQDDTLDDITSGSTAVTAGYRTSGNDPFNGSIDDIRLYNRTFPPAEVRQLYNYAPPPVAYYDFDESKGHPSDMLVYREGDATGTPDYRIHGGDFGTETAALTVTDAVQYMKVIAHPSSDSDEKILCTQDTQTTPDLECQVWDGSSWGNQTTLSSDVDANSIVHDLAYESISGDALVCHRDSATDGLPYCSVWDGEQWTNGLNATNVTNQINHIRLIPDPNSDYIALAMKDGNEDIHFEIWNGSAWQAASQLGTIEAANPTLLYQVDGDWESSGDFLAVWLSDTNNRVESQIYSKTTGWSGSDDNAITTITDPNVHIAIAANPNPANDEIMLVIGDDADDLIVNRWGGSSWDTQSTLKSSFASVGTDDRQFDIAYEHAGEYDAIVTYGETNTAVKYQLWDSSAQSWGGEVDLPDPTETNQDMHLLAADPTNEKIMLTIIGNGAADSVEIETLEWDGDDWEADYTSHTATGEDSSVTAWFTYDSAPDHLTDRSGNGNDGRMQTSMTESDWVPGKLGGALDFDATDDYIQTNSNELASADNFTVMAWFKTNDTNTMQHIVWQGDATGNGGGAEEEFEISVCDMQAGCSNELQMVIEGTSDDVAITYSGFTDTTNWHHLAGVVKDLDTATPSGELYLDGVLVGTDTGDTVTRTNWDTNLRIGRPGTAERFMDGYLDEVRIYNYARTQSQIIEDMNGGHPVGGSPVGSQVGYWKFDEGYGDTANDSITTGTDLDLAGACPGAGTCPTWSTSGRFVNALSFDGGDYASIVTASDDDLDFAGSEPFSITTWVYPTTMAGLGEYDGIITKWDATVSSEVRSYMMSLYNDDADTTGNINLQVYDESANQNLTVSSATDGILQNTWYHVGLTFNGGTAGAANDLQLYLNGQLIGGNSANASFLGIEALANDFVVGDWDPTDTVATNARFVGRIDEVKVYAAELTVDQMITDYNRGRGVVMGSAGVESSAGAGDMNAAAQSYCPPGSAATCTPPVGHWKLDEKTNDTCDGSADVCDISGNDNHGALSNSAWLGGRRCYQGSCIEATIDGTQDVVTITDPASGVLDFSDTDDFTWQIWMNYSTNESWVDPIVKGGTNTSNDGYATVLVTGTNVARCTYNDGDGSGADTVTGTVDRMDGKWHLITCVMDRDGAEVGTTGLHLYVDGVWEAADTSLTEGTAASNADNLTLGEFSTAYEYDGAVDDARIYDYARTPSQIAWDYNRGNPIGHWRLDECSGVTANDASGNGNNGTITIGATGSNTSVGTCSSGNSVEAWNNGTDGKFGSSLSFDGADDYVSLADPDLFDFSGGGSFSLSAWVKFDVANITESEYMLTHTNSTTDNRSIRLSRGDTEQIEFLIDDDGTTGTECTVDSPNNVLTDTSKWYHVMGVFDDTGNTQTIYIDGLVSDTGSCSTNPFQTDVDWIIGNEADLTRPWDGQIDDVRIYNYALTQEQVSNVYTGGAIRFGE